MLNDPFDDVWRLHEYIDRMFSDIFARKRWFRHSICKATLIDLRGKNYYVRERDHISSRTSDT